MASFCSFKMKLKGDSENINKFISALEQEGDTWIGCGASCFLSEDNEQLKNRIVLIEGSCNGGIKYSLIARAEEMRNNHDSLIETKGKRVITLIEACNEFKLDLEVYGSNSEDMFQEHLLILNGKVMESEEEEYREVILSSYDSKEDAENEFGEEISDEDWEAQDEVTSGGFIWEFEF